MCFKTEHAVIAPWLNSSQGSGDDVGMDTLNTSTNEESVLTLNSPKDMALLYIRIHLDLCCTDSEENFHLVVDCAKDVLKQHCCWPIVSDLINVLSHKPIAYKFMQNEQLLHFWFDLLACFQGNASLTGCRLSCVHHLYVTCSNEMSHMPANLISRKRCVNISHI